MKFCKWSESCSNPGPWLAYIDGQWFECVQPEKADKPLYCATHAREFLQPAQIPQTISEEDGEVSRNPKANPLLTFCRRMIETSTEDAQETFLIGPYIGEPTASAFNARAWFELRPDWHDKDEFYGSFEWCCHWLDIDIESTRSIRLRVIDHSLTEKFIALRREHFTKHLNCRELIEDNRPLQRLLTKLRTRFEHEEQELIKMAMASAHMRTDQLMSKQTDSQLGFTF
jgi:hypothetical protein